MDQLVSNSLKALVNDSSQETQALSVSNFPDSGSHYLDDIALYARTNDMRSDLYGGQNLILYTVYAFGDEDPTKNALAASLLKNAAKNGGFVDKNGDNRPTYTPEHTWDSEWDANGDGDPDT